MKNNQKNSNPLAAFEANVGTREKSSKGKPSKPLVVNASDTLQSQIQEFLLGTIDNAESQGIEATVNGQAFENVTNFNSLLSKESRSSSFFINKLNCNPAFTGLKFGVVGTERTSFKSLSQITFTLARADIAQIVSRQVGKVISSEIAEAYENNTLQDMLSWNLEKQLENMQARWEAGTQKHDKPTRAKALTALKGIKRNVKAVIRAYKTEA